ncbi:MAG: hypothetical protein QXT45_07495 [Candidatus Bilamarchaeaceae archaeon]
MKPKKKSRNKSDDCVAIKVLHDTNIKLNKLSDLTGLKKYRVVAAAVDLLWETEMNKRKSTKKGG